MSAAATTWALVFPPGGSYKSFDASASASQWPAAKTYASPDDCDLARSRLEQAVSAPDLKDKLAAAEKRPFTDSEAEEVKEYVGHATCVSRERDYQSDLAACREIIGGASVSGSGKELGGAGAGALAGASLGLVAGEHPLGLALLGSGLGAIVGTASSHANVRRAIDECLKLRGWTVLGEE
jgi:hypothetical protein